LEIARETWKGLRRYRTSPCHAAKIRGSLFDLIVSWFFEEVRAQFGLEVRLWSCDAPFSPNESLIILRSYQTTHPQMHFY